MNALATHAPAAKPASLYPTIGALISMLPAVSRHHARTTELYCYLDQIAKATVAEIDPTHPEGNDIDLGNFGHLDLPYIRMGAIDTRDSFGLDELMIFAFYWTHRNRYRRVADIGGNIGVHSTLMSRCGWTVETYEPDPNHLKLLRRNLALNRVDSVNVHEAAVSNRNGQLEFVRVLGNTTSSHLAGAKNNAYGELERFPVQVEPIEPIAQTVDFMKVDAEGEEKNIILGISERSWQRLDMMVEVGNPENAQAIFAFLRRAGLHAFAQKLGWDEVASESDMPTSYKEGSLFITAKPAMEWNL